MRQFQKSSALVGGFLVLVALPLFAQTEWRKYGCNPVLEPGPPGSWWEAFHGHSVLLESTPEGERVFKMWFTAAETPSSIGFASSKDGLRWDVRSEAPVLPPGKSLSWDDQGPFFPNVLKDEGKYRMWFNGNVGAGVGYAESLDGLHWIELPGNPVLPGVGQTWDGVSILDTEVPSVVRVAENDYRMWYTGENFTSAPPLLMIGMAQSPDGITWRKYPGNPVLRPGPGGAFDQGAIADAFVLFDGARFHLWYDRFFDPGTGTVFGYAQSADGIEWEKHPAAVLDRGPQGSWDGGGIDQPCVIFDDRANAFLLWYRGVDVIPPQTGIGFAISPAARRSVTLPVPGCPPEPVRVALRRQIRIGSPDQMLAIREVALGPFGASQVRAGAGGVARDLPEPPLPMAGALGEFQDGRAVGLAPYCGQGNGAVRYQDGTYTLENLGEGIGPGGDSFTLAYSRVKGDFRLTAHFKDTGPRPGMAGLMVRQDLTRRSRYSFVFDRFGDVEPLSGDPLDAFRWTRRPTQGGKDDELYLVLAPGEHYDFLAIERQGDRIRAFLSDGSTFEGLGEDPWPGIPDALLVGLAFGSLAEACCQGPKSIAFDRVKLELGPGAELLPPVLPPIGVEISWDVPRRELEEEGLSYEIALPAGELRFQSGEGGIAVAGDSRALVAPRACGLFKRADTDASGSIDISDPVALIGVLFLGESAPPCFDAADTDDSGDLDLSDVIYSLSWQFLGGPEPPAPGPRACGPDPNPAAAPCEYPPASCG